MRRNGASNTRMWPAAPAAGCTPQGTYSCGARRL